MLNYSGSFSSFSVNDCKRAKEFYENILGLKVDETAEGLSIKAGSTDVFVYAKENHQPATFTVLNFQVNNIEEAVDALTSSGIKFLQYDGELQTDEKGIFRGPVGPKIAWFTDPAGNILSVLEDQ